MVQAPGSAFYNYPRWLNMNTCIHQLPHRSRIKLMNETVVEQLMQLGPKTLFFEVWLALVVARDHSDPLSTTALGRDSFHEVRRKIN